MLSELNVFSAQVLVYKAGVALPVIRYARLSETTLVSCQHKTMLHCAFRLFSSIWNVYVVSVMVKQYVVLVLYKCNGRRYTTNSRTMVICLPLNILSVFAPLNI